jgi:hypothetical protein
MICVCFLELLSVFVAGDRCSGRTRLELLMAMSPRPPAKGFKRLGYVYATL